VAMLLGGNDQRECATGELGSSVSNYVFDQLRLFGAVLNRLERRASSDKFSNPIGAAPLQSSHATL
jgi:hypothetical protein